MKTSSQKKNAQNTRKRQISNKSNRPKATHSNKPNHSQTARSKQSHPKATHSNRSHESACPVSKKCGACQYLDIPYKKQLEKKQQFLIDLFEDFSEEDTVINPILGMNEPFYYRNKVSSPFAPGKKLSGAKTNSAAKRKKNAPLSYDVLCGMYAKGTHHIIPTDSCLLENKEGKRIILSIRNLMKKYGIEPYREDSGSGFMRHAIVRIGHSSKEILVTLVTNDRQFPGAKHFVRELVKLHPAITTVVQNINERQTNVILGEHEQRLYGPGFILDSLCGLSFRISSHSFYQVNATQTEVLYQQAIKLAKLTGTETVLDAYCGTGTIGLVAAKGLNENSHAARVIGVDNVASAIVDAKNNAHHNGIENAEFICDDAGEYLLSLAELNEGESPVDVLLMDPPRSGASEDFLRATCALSPARIVYISCNPNTQQRDVAYLLKNNYHIETIQGVDMFPHTNHVECIISLTKTQNN